jgi:enamine deaminase RidA (YjgF/YER057c/UK114 family)
MEILRWAGSARGRSRASAFGETLWLVANATDPSGDFAKQAAETLSNLDATLEGAGSHRSRLLSVQVILQDISGKQEFDDLWQRWIGPDPAAWPQRCCFQAVLTPGLLIEITAVAARG